MIKIRNLTKRKFRKEILSDITVNIPFGITGIVGPNGAGKSTLLKIISGIEKLTYGSLEFEVLQSEEKFRIGYLPQSFETYQNLTCKEVLQHYGYLKSIILDNRDVLNLLEEVNLVPYANIKVNQLSGGMKRRLGIAQTLIDNPDLLIIDEPTSGLDVLERIRFRNLIKKIGSKRSVIISSHIVEDIETVCAYIIVLSDGKLLYQGKKEDIASKSNAVVYTKEVHKDELDYYFNNYLVTSFTPVSSTNYQIRILTTKEKPIEGKIVKPSLDEYYISLLN
jgi:ABC-2 type transport system ATP-binding protein